MFRTVPFATVCLLAVAGAASAKEATASPRANCAEFSKTAAPAFPKPPEGMALVVIYRHGSGALMVRRSLYFLNGVNFAKLWNRTYTAVQVPAGQYQLAQRWPLDVSYGEKMERSMVWESGQIYFYEQNTDASLSYNTMTVTTSLDGGAAIPWIPPGTKCVEPINLESIVPAAAELDAGEKPA